MEDFCICGIRRIYKAIAQFEVQLQTVLGLNLNEAMLLCLLSDKDHLSAGEIADAMMLTRSNASKIISSLENASLIRRHLCKDDARCMRFSLTKNGVEKLNAVHCKKLQLPDELQQLVEQRKEATDSEQG